MVERKFVGLTSNVFRKKQTHPFSSIPHLLFKTLSVPQAPLDGEVQGTFDWTSLRRQVLQARWAFPSET